MRLISGILLLFVLSGCSTLGEVVTEKKWQAVVLEKDAPNWKHSHKRVTPDGQLVSAHLSGHAWLHRFTAQMTAQDLAVLNTLIASLAPEELAALKKTETEQPRPDYKRVTIEFDDGTSLVAVTGERQSFGNANVERVWNLIRKYQERAW